MPRITLLLNTHNFAPAQFLNHQANSATVFNGKLLFAKSEGLFESSGDNDGTETVGEVTASIPIEAWITLPTTDFGYNGEKGPRSIILSGRFDGVMEVALTSQPNDDEPAVTNEYLSTEMQGASGCKIALDNDQRCRMMKFKIGNVDGADFSLKNADLVFIPGPKRRR